VWNASAMDIPVAVFGDSFEEARTHFEEAIVSHFEVLCETNRIDSTVKHLMTMAKDRGFYERIPPRQAFEKFMINPEEPCLAHV
jgi:predicted RNase H-like HicB family nuclease